LTGDVGTSFPIGFEGSQFGRFGVGQIPEAGGQFKVLGLNGFHLFQVGIIDFLFQDFNEIRYHNVGQVYPGACFIHCIDGLVGEIAVGHVTLSQAHTGFQRLVRILYVVVFLVSVFDVAKYLKGFLRRGGFHNDLLEATFQRSVFFDALAVFIQRGGSDALEVAPGQCRFEHIGCIHGAGGVTSPNDGVDLVDEEDDVFVALQLIENGLHALFKLASVLGAGHHGGQVQRDHALVKEYPGDLSLNDAQGQAFNDGRLSNAWITDQNRVVLFTTAQNLGQAHDFVLTTYDGVKTPFKGGFGHVVAEIIQGWCIGAGGLFGAGLLPGITRAGRVVVATWQLVFIVRVFVGETGSCMGALATCDGILKGGPSQSFFVQNSGGKVVFFL